jgi:hypothetical protein
MTSRQVGAGGDLGSFRGLRGRDRSPEQGQAALLSRFANPASIPISLHLDVLRTSPIDLGVFDVSGRERRALMRNEKSPGRYNIDWDGKDDAGNDLPSGVYWLRLRSGNGTKTNRMVVVR